MENENVADPWPLNLVEDMLTGKDFEMESEFGQMRRSDALVSGLAIGKEPSMPNMKRLSLENKEKSQIESSRQQQRIETDGDLVFSTQDTSL